MKISEFHNYYMKKKYFYLVEFHDIDKTRDADYNQNIGIPQREGYMIISFFGHKLIRGCNDLPKQIEQVILKNIKQNEKIFFYCGGYGNFDVLCASVCRTIAHNVPNCEIVYITPYITEAQQQKIKHYINIKMYDSVIFPPLETVPPKYAILKRNEWMAEQADLIIGYVEHAFGGAYTAIEYARKKKKQVINLYEVK